MSLILKGIDMPMETDYLRLALLRSGRDNEVLVFDDETNALIGQAIQIPKGHGRVGDLDLLKDMIKDSVPAYGIGVKIPTYGDMDIMDKIGFVPTILEAEE